MQKEILKPDGAIAKHRYISMGLTEEDLTKPFVLILYEDGCADCLPDIKTGAALASGTAGSLCLPSLNDMTAAGIGKKMLLPARESVADMTEALLSMYNPDSVCIVARSEIAAAGMLMGAVRKNIPLVFMPAWGAIFGYAKAHINKAAVTCGKASASEVDFLENASNASAGNGAGRSLEMDNFNSIAIFCEGSGLSVFGSFAPRSASDRITLARETGKRAVHRAEALAYPRREFSDKSIQAGLAAHLACGGTLSSLIHIIAIARENSINTADFDYIADLSEKIPLLARLSPLGTCNIFDFDTAGGVRGILKELSAIPKLLDLNSKYGSARLCEVLDGLNTDSEIIAPLNSPFSESGVTAIKGNAFDTALHRKSANGKSNGDRLKLKAFVYADEELAKNAIIGGSVQDNSALIIKGQSAKNNGMPLLDIESWLCAKGLNNVVLITDGRCLELMQTPVICLADKTDIFDAVQSGDTVEIDYKKGRLNIDISSKEASSRLKRQGFETNATGSLWRYINLVGTANQGCTLKQKF